MPRIPRARPARRLPAARARRGGLRIGGPERLESRMVMSSVPYGASPQDTSEFFLGKVLVNVVLFESNGTIDPSTENWTPALIQEVKTKIEVAMDWWADVLADMGSVHQLDLQFNYQYADSPVQTGYEPINRTADYFVHYVYNFLTPAGYGQTGDFIQDVRAFNHAKRVQYDANWAFTIFVVNSTIDSDERFATGGTYTGAFAYYGALVVSPSGRPESTFAHEIGHVFWAFDEYSGGDSHSLKRGYLGQQNTNGATNAPAGFVQQDSIMSSSTSLNNSWAQGTLPDATKASIGWKDSDGDGVFDVYDVPQKLTGVGYYDPATLIYHFDGTAQVVPLINRNTAGTKNDMTLARVSRIEFRLDGGSWQTVATPDAYEATIDLAIPLPPGWSQFELRTIDAATGITSNTFAGNPTTPTATTSPGINGLAWNDADGDGVWDAGESPLSGWIVRLVDAAGQPVSLSTSVDPDSFAAGQNLFGAVPGVTFTAEGPSSGGSTVTAMNATPSGTGTRVFGGTQTNGTATPTWTTSRRLKIAFTTPQKQVSLLAVGGAGATGGVTNVGRIEAYNAAGTLLLAHDTSGPLTAAQTERLVVSRAEGDIAYIIASATTTAGVSFDSLILGPDASTVTDAQGRYTLPLLNVGNYKVAILPTPGWEATQGTTRDVMLSGGGTAAGADFSFRFTVTGAPYYNAQSPWNVDGTGGVTMADLNMLAAYAQTYGFGTLPAPGGTVTQFVDVNGDGQLSIADLAAVSSYVREFGANPPGSGSGGSGGGGEAATFDQADQTRLKAVSPGKAVAADAKQLRKAKDSEKHEHKSARREQAAVDLFFRAMSEPRRDRDKKGLLHDH